MIEDEELEKIINEGKKDVENIKSTEPIINPLSIKPVEVEKKPISTITQQTRFNEAVDDAKLNILKEAAATDEKFVTEVKSNVKDATLKLMEVEKERAELEKQNILYHQELKDKDRQINEYQQKENYWDNREKRRQYHYNGVKPIMLFVGIKEPMNLVVLYFLTVVLTPFFLIGKFIKGTFGVLIAGASDDDRPKSVKAILWTLLAVTCALIIAGVIYLFLKWQNIV